MSLAGRARCVRCGGLLGPGDAPHPEGCRVKSMTRVLVTLDDETLAGLDAIGPTRSEAIRTAVRAYVS